MTEYVDFFSVVIQASAGILGIIIAVVAVIYSQEVQARTPRTRELFDEIEDLRQEYREPFQDMSISISTEMQNDLYTEMLNDFSKCENIIKNPGEYRKTESLQAHIYRIEHYLAPQNLRDYHTLSNDQLNGIVDSAEWLNKNLSQGDDAKLIFRNIIHGPPSEDYYYYKSIFPPASRLEQWLQDQDYTNSGDDLQSYSRFCQDFSRQAIPVINKGRQETLVDYESPLRSTLCTTGVLLLVGVFVPSLFLLSPPEPIITISLKIIFIIQIIILIFVIATTGFLLYIIWSHLESGS